MPWFFRFIPRLSPQHLPSLPVVGRFSHLLLHPQLWRLRRESVARGAAVGVFFAFATPVAQIPASLALALVLRLHLPTAALATLVNTPLTFAPVYYAAYKVGAWLLGMGAQTGSDAHAQLQQGLEHGATALLSATSSAGAGVSSALLAGVVGALFFAVSGAMLAYAAVHLVWRLRALRRAHVWARIRASRVSN